MATSKPPIYATCKAGCQWETVHREEFEKSASHIRQIINANGTYVLEMGKEYKIYSPKDEDGNFTAEIKTSVLPTYSDGTFELKSHTFTLPKADEYADYFVFRYLGGKMNANVLTFVYECAGVRYEETITESCEELQPSSGCVLYNATDILLYNADATITADELRPNVLRLL